MASQEERKDKKKENEIEGEVGVTSDVVPLEMDAPKKPFPFSVFFILGNEFCERYSYYGMRTILVLYLKYYLHWDSNTATAVYHAFTVLAYLFPLVGAMLADSWLGKYHTILWLSIVYAIGMVINTLGAVGDLGDTTVHAILSSVGLFVIAIGTGGIKPCVSAFGGDQFDVDQDEYRRSFFSLFYFAINAGSLISTFVSPLIREEVQCFGGDCYALAFGIPAILMVVAIILFLFGTKWYVRYPPTGNVFLEVSKTIGIAIKRRYKTPSKQRNKDHWMDYADDGTKVSQILIRDIKYVLNVLIIFIPLPLFWTLFDQQGSRWTLQAVRMDGYVGGLRVLPDQMQICNPLLIVTMIPLFEATLYPCLRHFNINFSPLRRMGTGMFLAGVSFIVAALVQMMIDENLTKTPWSKSETSLRLINSADCELNVISNELYADLWGGDVADTDGSGVGGILLSPGNATDTKEYFVHPNTYNINYRCVGSSPFESVSVTLQGKQVHDLIISRTSTSDYQTLFTTRRTEKSDDGEAFISLANTFDQSVDFFIEYPKHKHEPTTVNFTLPSNTSYAVERGEPKGTRRIAIYVDGQVYNSTFEVKTGGLYTLVARNTKTDVPIDVSTIEVDQYTDIYYNDVNIFWMIPQYFVITLGEVFLSVTGLEFAYSQAPPSMKSVLQSFWLLTVAIGNIVVLIVAEASLIPSQSDEYFLFAGLIFAADILFLILAIRYKYVDESEFTDSDGGDSSEDETSLAKEDLGKVNPAYEHNTGF